VFPAVLARLLPNPVKLRIWGEIVVQSGRDDSVVHLDGCVMSNGKGSVPFDKRCLRNISIDHRKISVRCLKQAIRKPASFSHARLSAQTEFAVALEHRIYYVISDHQIM
jgi:hypothetical protein